MKKINFNIMHLLLAGLLLLASAQAQNKTGTTIAQFMKIDPSSRIAAMGNGGASLSGEISSVFYNPASLGRLQGTDIQFTFNRWLADITYNYMAAGLNIGDMGTIAIIGTMLNSGDIDVRTVDQPLGTGEKYSVKNFALGVAYGMMLTDRVSVGAQVNYINETIWHSSLNTFGLNLGVQYQVSEGGLTLGASMSNFGGRASYDGRDLYVNYDFDPNVHGNNDQLPAELRTETFPLPTIFRAGISYLLNIGTDYSFLASVDAIHPNDNAESLNLGAEITILKMVSLRGGFRNLFLPKELDPQGGLTLGGGVQTNFANYNIRFDYAYADYGKLAEAHRLTLSVGMK